VTVTAPVARSRPIVELCAGEAEVMAENVCLASGFGAGGAVRRMSSKSCSRSRSVSWSARAAIGSGAAIETIAAARIVR
jgi:hypothetical protein